MFAASLTISILLAVALLGSGVTKVRRAPAQVAAMTSLGVSEQTVPRLGLLEISATFGLLVGLFWWPIGLAAAIGAVIYFIGAVITHLRAGDKNYAPAAVLLLISTAALVLQLLAR